MTVTPIASFLTDATALVVAGYNIVSGTGLMLFIVAFAVGAIVVYLFRRIKRAGQT